MPGAMKTRFLFKRDLSSSTIQLAESICGYQLDGYGQVDINHFSTAHATMKN